MAYVNLSKKRYRFGAIVLVVVAVLGAAGAGLYLQQQYNKKLKTNYAAMVQSAMQLDSQGKYALAGNVIDIYIASAPPHSYVLQAYALHGTVAQDSQDCKSALNWYGRLIGTQLEGTVYQGEAECNATLGNKSLAIMYYQKLITTTQSAQNVETKSDISQYQEQIKELSQ